MIAAASLATIPDVQADTAQIALPPVGAEGSTAYVQVPSAKLRAQAQIGAPVLAQPVTNTPVKLIAKNGEWCEVDVLANDAAPPGGAAAARHGFMACNLLSAQVLTLEMVDAQIAALQLKTKTNKRGGRVIIEGKGNPDARAALDWYSRAFWIAPSLLRWTQVGVALENAFLDEETRSKEINENNPLRFKVPEFEAMKQRLAAGISVDPGTYKPASGLSLDDPGLSYMHVQPALARIKMPEIKPSLFKANEVPVVVSTEKYVSLGSSRAIELIDALSAANAAPFRAVVTGSASYALHSDMPVFAGDTGWRFIRTSGAMEVILGIWDVGGLHVTFSQDAVLHGVSAKGEPSALNIKEIALGIGYDSPCSYSRTSVQMSNLPVAGYAPPSSAMVSWAGKPVPGGASARAQVKSRRFSGESDKDLIVTHEIDLDRDGVVDFLIWQGRYQAQVSAEGLWEAVFGNIGGQWRLLDYNEDADCT